MKISGSVLEIEKDNFDPFTKRQRQVYCFAISAKRYARFILDVDGNPQVLQKIVNNYDDNGYSEHGLGHLLNPTDFNTTNSESADSENEGRDWIRQVWLGLIRHAMGLPVEELPWLSRPALSQIRISSAHMMRPFAHMNAKRSYAKRVKPFNFILSANIAPEGHPSSIDPNHFHLIAPFEKNPGKWEKLKWIDRYSSTAWKVSTLINRGNATTAKLKTYEDVVDQYAYRAESKCADQDGNTCKKQTVGLLQRRKIQVSVLSHIGKESNRLDEVEAGLVHSLDEVTLTYKSTKESEWTTLVVPSLLEMPIKTIMAATGLARSTVQRIRNQGAMPQRRHRKALQTLALAFQDQR